MKPLCHLHSSSHCTTSRPHSLSLCIFLALLHLLCGAAATSAHTLSFSLLELYYTKTVHGLDQSIVHATAERQADGADESSRTSFDTMELDRL